MSSNCGIWSVSMSTGCAMALKNGATGTQASVPSGRSRWAGAIPTTRMRAARAPGQPSSHQRRIRRRDAPPEARAHDGHQVRARPLVVRLEPAALQRRGAAGHRVEEAGRDGGHGDHQRLAFPVQRDGIGIAVVDGGQRVEGAGLLAPPQELGVGDGVTGHAAAGVLHPDADQAVLVDGERTQDRGIDDGEERGDHADAEAEGEDGDDGQDPAATQAAERVAEVLPDDVEHLHRRCAAAQS